MIQQFKAFYCQNHKKLNQLNLISRLRWAWNIRFSTSFLNVKRLIFELLKKTVVFTESRRVFYE